VELLGSLARAPAIVEKQNRDFVPFFLALEPLALPRRRLKAYLALLAKFVNPKAVHASSTLRDLHISLLSKPDRELQELALSCLFTYKSPELRGHEEQLRAVLDETKWRDELSLLDIGTIQDEHRPEVVRVFIGLLYGIIGEHKGRKHNRPDRRAAVLQVLCHATTSELAAFIDLMLTPFPTHASEPVTEGVTGFRGLGDVSVAQRAGFLNLLEDVLRIMGTKTVEFWPRLFAVTLEIIHSAQVSLGSTACADAEDECEEAGAGALDIDAEKATGGTNDSAKLRRAQRSLRQSGLKRIAEFFRLSTTAINYTPCVHLAFPSIVTPRLLLLSQENAQAPSALLELFVEWSSSTETISYLTEYDAHLLPRVFECLNGIKVKPSVVSKVLDIISNLISLSSDNHTLAKNALALNARKLLRELEVMFERVVKSGFKAEPITHRMIDTLSTLSSFMAEPEDAASLLSLILPLFRKPPRIVPEKVKMGLLHVMRHMSTLVPECRDCSSAVYAQCFDSLASLFQSLRTRSARVELVSTFGSLVLVDASLAPLNRIIASLNAYSERRVDEPDFDRRLTAFAELNDTLHTSLTIPGWKIVIRNMMFFIHDSEEVALRSSAAESLRLFIRAVRTSSSDSGSTESN
jgi:U3 small nucleolar RNA-associated protein 20